MTEPSVLIGLDTATGEEVRLAEKARAHSTYVIGITGTGKSTLLEAMAYQDIRNGDGICFLDPHDDSAERLLRSVPAEREKDVVFWDPADREYPLGLNPFWCGDPEGIDSTADNFVNALASLEDFRAVFASGAPRMTNLLQRLAVTFVANQGHTLAEAVDFLTDARFRASFYPALDTHEYPHIRRRWEEFDELSAAKQNELVGSSLNKLERLQTHRVLRGIFSQPGSGIDFRQAMDERRIVGFR